ncbi:MAG: hypothetical protein QF903_10190 [Planctomycetota bacterium]|jgi:hypothetical protein|nr:hypothetical protein [Planctomycetota bacterium]MDP6763180.1 hypothetical protein [Planctomycetota bacterium]MDP6989836.1 hypothetical protein [Planctomycetota bacterium]
MIASLALTAACAAASGPGTLAPPTERPEALIVVEATRIRARSFSAEPLVLLLASADRNVTALFPLAPGASAAGSFPRGALDDAWLEVFLPSRAGWATTGALCVGSAPDTGAELWVGAGGRLAARALGFGLLDLTGRTTGSLLPPRVGPFLARSGAGGPPLPTHVPIPAPGRKRPVDTPPEIGEEPLPPF